MNENKEYKIFKFYSALSSSSLEFKKLKQKINISNNAATGT